MPKVSVIIPTYNRSAMVREAIGSVLSQSHQDLEVIVVDDGSTDDTSSAVQAIPDERVKYLYKPNSGPAGARNLGLSKTTGEYIAFLDSDDLWPENYLEVMVSSLKNNSQFGAAYSPITVVCPDGRKICSYKKPVGKSGWLTLDLFESSFIWVFATLSLAEVWRDFYFDEQLSRICEDSDALLRLSMRTQFLFVPEVEPLHHITPDSVSAEDGVVPTRLLVLERFYFNLGGQKLVSIRIARRKLSHVCRKAGESHRRKGCRKAAIALFKRAISYKPTDIRLYIGLIRAGLLGLADDNCAHWQMPEPPQWTVFRSCSERVGLLSGCENQQYCFHEKPPFTA